MLEIGIYNAKDNTQLYEITIHIHSNVSVFTKLKTIKILS